MAGKMSMLAWTEKWETPVRARTIFDSRVNMLISQWREGTNMAKVIS
jgi:hypothetical protein